jgi:hypothetical protein
MTKLYHVKVTVVHTYDGAPIRYVERTVSNSSEGARYNIAARYWNAYSFTINGVEEVGA